MRNRIVIITMTFSGIESDASIRDRVNKHMDNFPHIDGIHTAIDIFDEPINLTDAGHPVHICDGGESTMVASGEAS